MPSLVWDAIRGLPPGRRTLRVSALLVAIGLCFGLVLVFGHQDRALASGAQAPETACSQSALQAALSAGQSTITFAPGCTIKLTSSLTIGAGVNITIDGDGLTLDGQGIGINYNVARGAVEINDASNPSSLTLNQVTVERGTIGIYDQSRRATINLTGSTIRDNGAGGVDAGRVSVSNSTVRNNHIAEPLGFSVGGIDASGTAAVSNSTVNGNAGAGISAGSTATVSNSVISVNAGPGVMSNSAVVAGSTINGNIGDGIQASTAEVADSTVSDNYFGEIDAAKTATVTSSTVTGSGLNCGSGQGATCGGNGIEGDTITVTDSTITGSEYGDGINATGAAMVTASLLSGNETNCAAMSLSDRGYSLSTDDSCHFSATGSKNNVSASALHLLSLANNGGPTQTVALGPDSIAIDAIPVLNGKCAVGMQTDQRGVNRPQGKGCDIGAYEAIPNSIYFPQTNHFLSNGFLAFWQHFGGLAVFGYPISNELQQNGVTVQYFQRARFEWHPGSDPARYDVELGLLGDQAAITARQQTPAPFAPITAHDNADCTFYAQTGHRLCFGFRAFWQTNGGLANFGYPISEEFKDPTTGLTVQYFERAVFEYHPNNPVAYQVELRLLGDEQFGPQP